MTITDFTNVSMTRLVNRSQLVSPGKVRQGHLQLRELNFSTEGHHRWSRERCRSPSMLKLLWTTVVRCCQRRGYKRFCVPHIFLHREGQEGRRPRSKEEDAPSSMAPVLKKQAERPLKYPNMTPTITLTMRYGDEGEKHTNRHQDGLPVAVILRPKRKLLAIKRGPGFTVQLKTETAG
ncbi:hypothetical protein Q1695_000110 [Nippostrongylus brasiliensis]|nr:hypothetical protein Q1695_000110 [Nippostrongylus brasiliensis]